MGLIARWTAIPAIAIVATAAISSDWPQWRGPLRDGLSSETGLLKEWPAEGPPVEWRIRNLGAGYGTVAVSGDRIYIQGQNGRNSVVYALDRSDGKTIWMKALGKTLSQDRGDGPRGTPTVDGERLYALTEAGDLACLNAQDGSTVWEKNILQEFGGSNPNWLLSESPLIDGNNLIVSPGGRNAGIVALDRKTGHTVWKTADLSDPAAYSSAIAAEVQGVRTIMNFTARGAVGVRATDGKLLWRYDRVANRTANIATPVFHDNRVFFTSAYGTGCVLLDLRAQDGGLTATEIYFSREMMNHHGGVVLVNGYLYGFSNAILTCMEFETGKVMWKDRSVGKGCLTFADGNLYLLGEGNTVGLAVASPKGYVEKGRFQIEDQGYPSWAHPVVSGGRLYIRNQATLTCYGVGAR